jgi:hypothetical protein
VDGQQSAGPARAIDRPRKVQAPGVGPVPGLGRGTGELLGDLFYEQGRARGRGVPSTWSAQSSVRLSITLNYRTEDCALRPADHSGLCDHCAPCGGNGYS